MGPQRYFSCAGPAVPSGRIGGALALARDWSGPARPGSDTRDALVGGHENWTVAATKTGQART